MDPLNPGQFFACCGLFELMARSDGDCCACFDVDESRPRRGEFTVRGDSMPALREVLEKLRGATFETVEDAEKAVWPVRLQVGSESFVLDWWLKVFREGTTNLKCWAGQVTTAKLFGELPKLIEPEDGAGPLMARAANSKSKFGVDPRSAWNTLDFGFSPNEQGLDAATYPAVEVLAAIGLQGFRPPARRRSSVRYHLWTVLLPLGVARMAGVAAWEGLPRLDYEFSIEKRGQSYKYFSLAKFIERKGNNDEQSGSLRRVAGA